MMKSSSFSRNTQVLTGEAEHYKVDVAESRDLLPGDFGDVAQVRHTLVVVGEDGRREFFDLGKPGTHPAEGEPRHAGSVDPREERKESH